MKLKLHWQILIALILGGVLGATTQWTEYMWWAGTMFMNALSMLVVPLIFSSIVSGIVSVSSQATNLKSIGIRTFSYYIITMLIAAITGLTLVNIIRPGDGVNMELAQDVATIGTQGITFADTLLNMIPKNVFQAFSGGNMLPVIFFAVLVGIFINKTETHQRKTLADVFNAFFSVMIKMTHFVIRFAPIGVFAIVAKQVASVSDVWGLIGNLSLYVLTVGLGIAILMFVWMPLLLRFRAKVRPFAHFKNMANPLITAFSTASSNAALPLSMEAVEHKDKVSQTVTSITLPLGATINMNGTALLEGVAVIFIAQAYGIDLSISQQCIVAFTAVIAAIGSAGIPMAGMVMISVVLTAVGLPLEGVGLVIGVDRILDMMRTTANVYGDTCVAVLVAKDEGEKLPIDIKSYK